ncbi:uncharacterized protein LOC107716539 [Sinocyclocheilus rhinocerous]|uniref:uncharacterized protein LOC107716539 n=1 Tax=Sinocyclocheilus rhinocerous TaxID=307959 RepID=UPI0007BA1467|nr:PREDICTED: uncharacterized protein LOC107716539 [Sinocyclocheilus rhinocerous]
MSGCKKPRAVANPLESTITSPSERILKECHTLYIDNDNGLVKIAECLGVRLLPPQKKIIVMIMGNHSAGKSSFINWYVEEHIQKTGVAIETQGFTFITSGRKRESLTGNATLHLYPHFRPLLEFKVVLHWLALCGSTLKLPVEELLWNYTDEVGRETDRQRVMMQIVQELCRRPGLNKCGFEMPTIYIPNHQNPSRCINQIDEVCETIEKSINQAVQKTLDQLEKDCNLIISTINHTLEQDRMNVSSNKSNRFNSFLCGVVGIFLPSLFILSFIISTFAPEELDSLVGEGLAKTLYFSTGIVVYLWDWIPEDWQIMFVIIFGALCYFMFLLAKYFASQGSKTLTKREKKQLAEYSDYIQDIVKSKKRKLYEEYLRQCAAEYDF